MYCTYDISEALEEMLPRDVRPKLVSHLKRADLHNDAQIISSIENHFNTIIRSSDPFTKQVKDFFEWKKNFSIYLSTFQNTLVYDETGFHRITRSKNSFISELHQNMGNQFSLFESIATGTSWDAQANRRILNQSAVYKLKYNPTGFYITFLAPSSEAFLHVFMVHMPKHLQGSYIRLKTQFGAAFDALLHWNDLKGLESICLKTTKHMPGVRGTEWRTIKLKDGDTKLMRMWKRLGGIIDPTADKDRLFFMRFNEALEFKKAIEAEGHPSPYRYLYKSIYSKEEEAALKG
tara:strand:+ start:2671 stop:3543 length:873 start_codon:yes stop_codon:yes gene_type:complete